MRVLDGVLLGAGALLGGYCLVSTLLMGPVRFNGLLLMFGLFLVALSLLDRRFGTVPGVVKVKKILLPVCLAGICLFLVLLGFVISGAARKDTGKGDYILILGAGLTKGELSRTLLERMEAALECDQGEVFVVSGGQGFDEPLPEGRAMERWLLEKGIPPERILVEEKSTNTHENLIFSRELIEAHAGKPISGVKVKIVTSDFHCYRAGMLARRQGYEKVSSYGGKTPAALVPTFYIREALALAKSFLLDR